MTEKTGASGGALSKMRKKYILKLIFRCVVLLTCAGLYIWRRSTFDVISGMNFFRGFSVLHILWVIWIADMIMKLFPTKKLPLGSQKLFGRRYVPVQGEIDPVRLRDYTRKSALKALGIFVVWASFNGVIGVLFYTDVFDLGILFLFTAFFYVADLICVLIWCPFRLILGNRCCATCRIFNWDHMMMFSPMFFIPGFYSLSLAAFASVTFIIWETTVFLHPERFWDGANRSLRCGSCSEKLCSHLCRKK